MPESLRRLIEVISFLPGIWEKTATKLAFFLLKSHPSYLDKFSSELEKIQKEIHECNVCGALTDMKRDVCEICENTMRDSSSICVIEDYLDMIALERLGIYKGKYHILWGAISPINGILPSDLKIKQLFERLRSGSTKELIIACNPNIEGEATTMYIKENLPREVEGLRITRLSKWLPNSGYIEYADEITLINAFKGRN